MRLAVSRAVFRLGPAWSVVAGAIAVGALRPEAPGLLRVLTAAVLADLAWGAIRQVIPIVPVAASLAMPTAQVAPTVGMLPFARPDAPLARWLAALTPAYPLGSTFGGAADAQVPTPQVSSGAWQGVLVISGLALVLSLLLGWPAVALTLVALATIWVAAATGRRGEFPALAHALLDVGWAWLLGMSLVAGELAGAEGGANWTVVRPGLLLAAAFTVLQVGHVSGRHAAQVQPGGHTGAGLVRAVWCFSPSSSSCVHPGPSRAWRHCWPRPRSGWRMRPAPGPVRCPGGGLLRLSLPLPFAEGRRRIWVLGVRGAGTACRPG